MFAYEFSFHEVRLDVLVGDVQQALELVTMDTALAWARLKDRRKSLVST